MIVAMCMANPQLENGFTKMTHDLIEALCSFRLNGTQYRLMILVVRLTYGYNRPSHEISVSYAAKVLNVDLRQLRKELKILIDLNIISVEKEETACTPRTLGINENYEKWIRRKDMRLKNPGEGKSGYTRKIGFTKISNELLEAIYSCALNGTEYRILLWIIRSTYGYHNKFYNISISFLCNALDIKSRQLRDGLKSLIEMNVVIVAKGATSNTSRMLGINKNYDKWSVYKLREGELDHTREGELDHTREGELDQTREGELDHTREGELDHQKRKDKEKIKKRTNSQDALFERLWEKYPVKKGKFNVDESQKMKLEEVGEENITKAIKNYAKDCAIKIWREKMHGDTFFNGGYESYLPSADEKQNPKTNVIREIRYQNAEAQKRFYERLEIERLDKINEKNKRLGRM